MQVSVRASCLFDKYGETLQVWRAREVLLYFAAARS